MQNFELENFMNKNLMILAKYKRKLWIVKFSQICQIHPTFPFKILDDTA